MGYIKIQSLYALYAALSSSSSSLKNSSYIAIEVVSFKINSQFIEILIKLFLSFVLINNKHLSRHFSNTTTVYANPNAQQCKPCDLLRRARDKSSAVKTHERWSLCKFMNIF